MTFPEEVILNLDRPGVCLALRLVLGDQTTIFCLQTNDSIHRSAVSNENCALATEKSSRFQRGEGGHGGGIIYHRDTENTEFRIFLMFRIPELRVPLGYWG